MSASRDRRCRRRCRRCRTAARWLPRTRPSGARSSASRGATTRWRGPRSRTASMPAWGLPRPMTGSTGSILRTRSTAAARRSPTTAFSITIMSASRISCAATWTAPPSASRRRRRCGQGTRWWKTTLRSSVMPPMDEKRSPRSALARVALILLLGPGLALLGQPEAAAQSGTPTAMTSANLHSEKIQLPVGQSRIFTTDADVERLVIGDPDIADVVLTSPRSFYVLGRGLGKTNLQVFAGGQDFPSGLMDLEVTVDTRDLSSALRAAAPGADIRVQSVNGRLRLYGTVPDAVTLDRVLEIAGQYGSDEVINALQVRSPQQVFLEVRIIEASRDAGRALGVNLNVFNGADNGDSATINSGRP